MHLKWNVNQHLPLPLDLSTVANNHEDQLSIGNILLNNN